jgi:hypothetical protein
LASYFPAQKNLIEMSRYLDNHPHIKQVYRVQNVPEWITDVFVLNKSYSLIDAEPTSLEAVDWGDCSNTLIVGSAQEADLKIYTEKLILLDSFNVNLIEQLAFKLNPEKNLRRVRLNLYSGPSCSK